MSACGTSRFEKERRQFHWPRVLTILVVSAFVVLASYWAKWRSGPPP